MAFFKFSKEDVDEQQGFELLPAAKYIAVITDSEWKETKDGNGHYLALTFEIIGPEFAGRKVFENFNLDNVNDQASKIAARQFRDLCDAIDARKFCDEMYEASSMEELQGFLDSMPEAIFNQPVEINVGVQKSKDPQYSDNNKIKAYAAVKKLDSAPPKWKDKK